MGALFTVSYLLMMDDTLSLSIFSVSKGSKKCLSPQLPMSIIAFMTDCSQMEHGISSFQWICDRASASTLVLPDL